MRPEAGVGVLPRAASPLPQAEHRLSIIADPLSVRGALSHLRRQWRSQAVPAGAAMRGEQVMAEVLNNVVEHAAPATRQCLIEIVTRTCGDGLDCVVRDNGRAMSGGLPPARTAAALPTTLADLPEGGFGWTMIHALSDRLAYARCEGWNVLSFRIPAE